MTAPRPVEPGTYLVTRRTTRRHFLLRPDSDGTMQQLYWYATIVYAKEYGIEVNATQMLSDHGLCAAAHNPCYGPSAVMRSDGRSRDRDSRSPFAGCT